MKFFARYIAGLLSCALLFSAVRAQQNEAARNDEFEVLKNLEIFSAVYKNAELVYVDGVNPGSLIKTALDAMLRTLDPYTVYIPEAEIEDFRIMTEGEYGGIGSTIHARDGWIYISDPYEGFPADQAGLKPGDRIVAINGESTQGKNVSDVSALLKGQAGTSLVLLVEREGSKPKEYNLVRREIKIKNVTYSGMLRDEVGYIRQDGFTQGAVDEVRQAFLDLREKGMKYLVYDLRYNGGGLLNEAVDIVNLFYRKGVPVVSTKGKLNDRNYTYHTSKDPVDTEIPIVFLTSRGTASASEILTGAMQDYDRAVLVGERTFGKGLVQNILPLPYNAQMKVTVAKYYIPSGRCVQALDYSHKDENGHALPIPDSLRNAFKTAAGRVVYDGDGIEPDVEVESPIMSEVAISLVTKFLIFDYANRYAAKHDKIGEIAKFEVSDAVYNDFLAFMKDKDYKYQLPCEKVLERFKTEAQNDSCWNEVAPSFALLEETLAKVKTDDLIKNKKEIASLLREEIISRYYYQSGRAEAELQGDETVNEAIEVLLDSKRYHNLLSGKASQKE
ncbi:MAG: S41 family peptidase [Lentimicrobiaceae bacterium]|nr:S41 family peptidase [Lentimicrobiaceae bacterium]